MPRSSPVSKLSPGEASYVLDRLLAARRIAPSEVTQYAVEMREIAEIEERLGALRGMSGKRPRSAHAPVRSRAVRRAKSPAPSPALRLNGRYIGYYRQIPAKDQAKYSKMRKEKGVKAAITAMRQQLGK